MSLKDGTFRDGNKPEIVDIDNPAVGGRETSVSGEVSFGRNFVKGSSASNSQIRSSLGVYDNDVAVNLPSNEQSNAVINSSYFESRSSLSELSDDDKENHMSRLAPSCVSRLSSNIRISESPARRDADDLKQTIHPKVNHLFKSGILSGNKSEIIKRLTERYNPLQENSESSLYKDEMTKMDIIKRAAGRYKFPNSSNSSTISNMDTISYEDISIGTSDSSLTRPGNSSDGHDNAASTCTNPNHIEEKPKKRIGKTVEDLIDDIDLQEMSDTALLYASGFQAGKHSNLETTSVQSYRRRLHLSVDMDDNHDRLQRNERLDQEATNIPIMAQSSFLHKNPDGEPHKKRGFKSRIKLLFGHTSRTTKYGSSEVVSNLSVDEIDSGSRLDLRVNKDEIEDDISWTIAPNRPLLKTHNGTANILSTPSKNRVSWWDSPANTTQRTVQASEEQVFHCCTLHKLKKKEELFRCHCCKKHLVKAVEDIEEPRPHSDIFDEIDKLKSEAGNRTPTESAWLCFSYK